MSAPTVTQLREGLAANLSAIANVQPSAYMLSNPTPPSIEVVPDAVDYDAAMGRGDDTWRFVIRAYVGVATDKGAQMLLDELLAPSGARSVKTALEADETLGGAAEDLHVKTATGYRIYARAGGPELLGCEWTVEVIAVGK